MAIGVGSLVSRVYENFRGMDTTKRNVSLSRSPDMVNMWINYKTSGGKCIETRPGLSSVDRLSGKVNGMHQYVRNSVQKVLVHSGTSMYLYTYSNGTLSKDSNTAIYTGLTNTKSYSIMYDDILIIKDGTHYLQYNGTTVSEVTAYTPRTRIGCLPASGDANNSQLVVTGSSWEAVNMLSDYRVNSYVGDGVGTKFKLNETSIDNDFTPYVEVDGVEVASTNYSVDYTNAVITFTTAPSQALTEGEDNVFIKYKKAVSGYKTKITNCKRITAFNNTIFYWGNPDYPNTMWFAESTQTPAIESQTLYNSNVTPSYIPDINFVKDGYDYGTIKAVVPSNNALWVFKDETSETTVFYHIPQWTYKNGESSLGHYDYASTYSSIARGCKETGINFGDDIVYYSNRGLEGITGDITTEQSTAHRSTLIDDLLTATSVREMQLVEYEGYLLITKDNNVYLADSRSKFQYEDHIEYDFFKWSLDELSTAYPVTLEVIGGTLFVGASDGRIYSLTNTLSTRSVYAYWTTPEDEFMVGQYQKTTSKRGCVINMIGEELKVSVKTDNNSFEDINTYTNTGTNPKNYVVARIKRKKWKGLQLKFSSSKPFGIYSCTLQAYVGGYVKR